jgi:8-oxo-dGTP pyrophosphatase MutT (NUDIX family)
MSLTNKYLFHVVQSYLSIYPEEKDKLKLLLDQLNNPESIISRKNFVGHITASGFVLDKTRRKVVLIKHLVLDKFLQPGGHIELKDNSLLDAAIREIKEETGLDHFSNLEILPSSPEIPLDINSHHIPENSKKAELAHFHHDFRFCFVLNNENVIFNKQETEVSECRMVDLLKLTDIVQFTEVYKKIRSLSTEHKPARFFNEVLGNTQLDTATESILVTHILQERPALIKAIDKVSSISGIIPKPNSIHKTTLSKLSTDFNFLQITKELKCQQKSPS